MKKSKKGEKKTGKKAEGSGDGVGAFLENIRSAQSESTPSVALGKDIRLESDSTIGFALEYENALLHLSAFAREKNGKVVLTFVSDDEGGEWVEGEGCLVVLDAYPLDAIDRKLMFGARKGVTQTVVTWFTAHLENNLGLLVK